MYNIFEYFVPWKMHVMFDLPLQYDYWLAHLTTSKLKAEIIDFLGSLKSKNMGNTLVSLLWLGEIRKQA